MVLPVKVGDVRSPDSPEARNISHRPSGYVSKDVTAQTPGNEIFRTSDCNAGSRRKELKGVAVLNNGRIVYLTDVALGVPEWKRSVGRPQRRLGAAERDKFEFSSSI